MGLFESMRNEAQRQQRQNDMARTIIDMEGRTMADIITECFKQYDSMDLEDIAGEMRDLAQRSRAGTDALQVLFQPTKELKK